MRGSSSVLLYVVTILVTPNAAGAQAWTAHATPTDAGRLVAGPAGEVFQLNGPTNLKRPDALVTRFRPRADGTLVADTVDDWSPSDGVYPGPIGYDGTAIWVAVAGGYPAGTTWEIRRGQPTGSGYEWENSTVPTSDHSARPNEFAFTASGAFLIGDQGATVVLGSSDGGLSWKQVDEPLADRPQETGNGLALAAAPDGSLVSAGNRHQPAVSGSSVWWVRYSNDGLHWEEDADTFSPGNRNFAVDALFYMGQFVVGGTENGNFVIRGGEGGKGFTTLYSRPMVHPSNGIAYLASGAAGHIYLCGYDASGYGFVERVALDQGTSEPVGLLEGYSCAGLAAVCVAGEEMVVTSFASWNLLRDGNVYVYRRDDPVRCDGGTGGSGGSGGTGGAGASGSGGGGGTGGEGGMQAGGSGGEEVGAGGTAGGAGGAAGASGSVGATPRGGCNCNAAGTTAALPLGWWLLALRRRQST